MNPDIQRIDNLSLQESLLPEHDPRREEAKKSSLDNISLEPVTDSSRNRGYRPPGAPDDFVSEGSSSTTGGSSPVDRRSTSKSNTSSSSHLYTQVKNRVSSLLPKTESDLTLREEAQRKDEQTIKEGIEFACIYLKKDTEANARAAIGTALRQTERFYFFRDNLPAFKAEIEKLLTIAQEQVMNEARQKAYDLLNTDPQKNEERAREELKIALRQSTPAEKYAQLSKAERSRQVEEMLIELRAEV